MLQRGRYWQSILLLQLIYWLLTTQTATAHTILIRAEPMDGAVLSVAPATIELWFSEAIVPRLSSVQLLNEQNQPVAGLLLQATGEAIDHLQFKLPALTPGGYTLFWKVLANSDGHFTQGFTTLTIGQSASTKFASQRVAAFPPLAGSTLRWLNYLLLTMLIGAVALVHLVLAPAQAQPSPAAVSAQQQLRRQVLQWAAVSAGGAFLVGLGLLWWQVINANGALLTPSTGALREWIATTRLVLLQTQWGIIWLVRQSLLLVMSGVLAVLARRQVELQQTWLWLVIYGRVIDLTIVQALASHVVGNSNAWLLAVGTTALHLLAAGIWVGGLMIVALAFAQRHSRVKLSQTGWQPIRWRAFSSLAAISVGVLIVTGLFNLGIQVASVDALLTTPYGQLLLGKIILVSLAGLCGLANARLVHPRLANYGRRPDNHATARPAAARQPLPRWLFVEAALGVVILAVVGVLTATPPPHGPEYTIAPETIKALQGQRVDNLIVTLEAKPNRPGRNLFNIRVVDTVAANAAPIQGVALAFAPQEGARPSNMVRAKLVEPGLYQVVGDYLDQAGAWQISVLTQRAGQAEQVATFAWVTPPAGDLPPVRFSKAPLSPLLLPVIATFGILMLLALSVVRRYTFIPQG